MFIDTYCQLCKIWRQCLNIKGKAVCKFCRKESHSDKA